MLYQDQTVFGKDRGNCLATCIANLLDLPLEQVPNFLEEDEHWWKALVCWLNSKGLSIISVREENYSSSQLQWANCLCIACGTSPRKIRHAVIWQFTGPFSKTRGHLLHDPHPSHLGLIEEPDEFLFLIPNRIPNE